MQFFIYKIDNERNISLYTFDNNLIPTFSAVMLKKMLLDNLDFNSPIKASLDWYLWFQIIQKKTNNFTNKTMVNGFNGNKIRKIFSNFIHTSLS